VVTRSSVPVVLVLAAVLAAGPARAERPTPRMARILHGWPQPAAGVSASGSPEVVLTFDDGPDPDTTPVVLEILRERKIRAIFFQVGWHFKRGDIAGAISMSRRIIASGHVIGNHTITHAHLCIAPPERIVGEITGGRELLEAAAEMPVPWFRTPYGARCPRLEAEMAALGVTHFHWDIDPQEWQGGGAKRTSDDVLEQVVRLRDDQRAVLLMHDTKDATRVALPLILDGVEVENARRAKLGRKPIRFVGGDQVAAERMAPTLGWLALALTESRAQVEALLDATVP